MSMKLVEPTKLILPSGEEDVRRFLTYTDRSVGFQMSKLKRNMQWRYSDPEGFAARIAELKAEEKKTLIYQDHDGSFWTYSGLKDELNQRFGWQTVSEVKYPESKSIPWKTIPKHDARYYQNECFEALIREKHAAAQLPTGSGKTRVIMMLLKHFGLQSIVVAPYAAIADQIYNELCDAFGEKWVGKFGDGSKTYKKKITVAVAQSLSTLTSDCEAYDTLKSAQVFIFDESHACPADTFKDVCMGVVRDTPFRFFLSATQTRNDGSEMLLKGITGPVVYQKEFSDLVSEGFLSPLLFKVFKVPAFERQKQDAKAETRANLYANPYVNSLAASIANKSVTLADRQTIILIEEFRQFEKLLPHLTVPFEFVHGGISKDAKEYVQQQYWKTDKEGAINRFNEGKTRLLIGTSAISVGVDLRPTECIVYLQGGTSEIKVKQAIGRGTRLHPGKKDCWIVDFEVQGSATLERHALVRKNMYYGLGVVEEY